MTLSSSIRTRSSARGRSRTSVGASAPLAAVLVLGLSACTLPGQPEEPVATAAVDAPVAATPTPGAATTAPTSGTAYDLRFVSPNAAACSVVWTPGAVLPENYEWCSDPDGRPVAGVRIGSCEVITYRNEMYAVPGETISASLGDIHLDRQFAELLTSCKRRPATSR